MEQKHTFSDSIVFHGMIPQQYVSNYLKNADYSVLLRPNKRYAQAGFPTKFVESLNMGLPVVSNLTSDLKLYLKDGYNGFVIPDTSKESILEVFNIIANVDINSKFNIRKNARITAINNFNYKLFTNQFVKFFKEI